MRTIFRVILALAALGLPVFSQAVSVTANKVKVETPAGACNAGQVRVATNGTLYTCVSGTWTAHVGAAAGDITLGATTVNGTNTRVLYDNSGVVGEYAITGTGNVVMSASPTLTGTIGAASATFSGTVLMSGTPQTLTGPGAVNLTTYSTLLVTTGADALTLAAGSEGQLKFIRLKTDGGDGVLTVANLQGGTTVTFNDAGDFVLLFYQDSRWHILTNSGCVIA